MQTVERFSARTHIGGENVSVTTHQLTKNFPLHWHNYFEIEIVTGGKGIMSVNGQDYDTDLYKVFLLTPVDFHSITVQGQLQLMNISFDTAMLSDRVFARLAAPVSNAYTLQGDAMERFLQAAALLHHECAIGGSCKMLLCEYILACLLRQEPNPAARCDDKLSGIKKAILYLDMHFKEDIRLEDLAKQAGFHVTYFSELFRKTTGQTYKQRLTQLRLEYAKTLLRSGFPVSQVCFESGFGSVSNFNAVFQKACGMTPKKYARCQAAGSDAVLSPVTLT